MRWNREGWLLLLVGSMGCSSSPWTVSDNRPPTTPAPVDVQAEIRDARFFLAYPDETVGPSSGLQPRTREVAPSSK